MKNFKHIITNILLVFFTACGSKDGKHNMLSSKNNKLNDQKESYNNIKLQAKAMEYATHISQGLQKGDQALTFKGLQLISNISPNSIENPKIVMEKILDALASKSAQWESYGIKRHIAKQLRKYVHRMYKVAKKHKKCIHSNDKKAIIEKIDYVLDQIDEEKAPGNGLRFELDLVRAMVKALPDTDSFWDTYGESVMDLFEAYSDKNPLKLKTLALTIYEQLKTKI